MAYKRKETSNKYSDEQNAILVWNMVVFSHLRLMQIYEFGEALKLDETEKKRLPEVLGKRARLRPSLKLINAFVEYSGFSFRELSECRLNLNATFDIPHNYLNNISLKSFTDE